MALFITRTILFFVLNHAILKINKKNYIEDKLDKKNDLQNRYVAKN